MKRLLWTITSLSVIGISIFFVSQENEHQVKKNISVEAHKTGAQWFNEYHKEIRINPDRTGQQYPNAYRAIALKKMRQFKKRGQMDDITWTERGPYNVPGRTRAIITRPDDPLNHWMAASVGGGIWETVNAGQQWTELTDNVPNIAISCVVSPTSDPAIIYAGTGEDGFFNTDAIVGDGLLKTTDFGRSWNLISDVPFRNVNRLAVDDLHPDTLIAATDVGIYKTIDGGQSWKAVIDDGNFQDLKTDPTDFNIQIASENGRGLRKSVDGGETWSNYLVGVNGCARYELAFAPSNTQKIYVSAYCGSESTRIFMSEDAGEVWIEVQENEGLEDVPYLAGQGWYDNALAVNPFNENEIYVGGVNFFKLTIQDGGATLGNKEIVEVNEDNTDFMSFVNFGGGYLDGGLARGDETGDAEDLEEEDVVSVEIRFGPGISQKAHRYTVGKIGAGVDLNSYFYEDYVDVPFEVWDTTNDRQLMASFRDQQEDSVWNLIPQNTDGNAAEHSREYLFVNAFPYDANDPSPEMTHTGGIRYKELYFFWPVLAEGATFDGDDLPEGKIEIKVEAQTVFRHASQNITDAYGAFGGNNEDVHPDQHFIMPVISNETAKTFKLLVGNDGGVYHTNISNNPGINNRSWIQAGNGFNTGQFYGATKKPGENRYIGGLQDNGTHLSDAVDDVDATTTYTSKIGGDGFEVFWSSTNPNQVIGSSQFNGFRKSLDGGVSWQGATSGYTDDGPFISKISGSPKTNWLYTVGATGVWYSDNFANNWKSTTIINGWSFGGTSRVEPSLSDPDLVWAGAGMTNTRKIQISRDRGISFKPVNNFTAPDGGGMGNISGLTTHPFQDSTAYVMFSQPELPKVLRTKDLGETWEDLSGFSETGTSTNGFPDVATYCLLVLPTDTATIWVGTDIGIVASEDHGQNWFLLDSQLPNTAVWDMVVMDDQVVIATHGRGIWTATVPELLNVSTDPPLISGKGMAPTGDFVIDATLRGRYDSLELLTDGTVYSTSKDLVGSEVLLSVAGITKDTSMTIQLVGYRSGEAYQGIIDTTELFVVHATQDKYYNDFNSLSIGVAEEFYGDLFEIQKPSGFESNAVHSPHPYEDDNRTYISYLRAPIQITGEDAFIRFKDIALIEPGNSQTFGNENFFDYVVIEATKNGIDWIPVMDGYDASRFDDWLDEYDKGSDAVGSESLFKDETFTLLSNLNVGDLVLFRFKLFSDPNTVSWGWALDNLAIQTTTPILGIEETNVSQVQLFPNPAFKSSTLRFGLEVPDELTMNIYEANGKLVVIQNIGEKSRGNHEIQIKTSLLRSGLYVVRLIGKETQVAKRLLVR